MSVLKRNRKESQFEVFHHLYKFRREITDLLLRDFGYSFEKSEKRLKRMFGDRSYEDLADSEKERYDRLKKRHESFDEWFIIDQRKVVLDCLRSIQKGWRKSDNKFKRAISESATNFANVNNNGKI